MAPGTVRALRSVGGGIDGPTTRLSPYVSSDWRGGARGTNCGRIWRSMKVRTTPAGTGLRVRLAALGVQALDHFASENRHGCTSSSY